MRKAIIKTEAVVVERLSILFKIFLYVVAFLVAKEYDTCEVVSLIQNTG